MRVVSSIEEARRAVNEAKAAGKTVGFVPTMGALHQGHAALIRRSVAECDVTVVSIFVNPLQFGPAEDFEQYPRDFEADEALCRSLGADLIFAPSVKEMYPDELKSAVEVTGLTEHLCGAKRPGHFRGVTTVVTKLFHAVPADKAYFGEKDFQQLVVIRRMVRDLNFPVEIVAVPTVREDDGLAVSSRNRYLTAEERRAAAAIYRALSEAKRVIHQGERDRSSVLRAMRRVLQTEPLLREDYVELVDPTGLEPIARIAPDPHGGSVDVLAAVAVFCGTTRLIDNILIRVADNSAVGEAGSPARGER